MNSQPKAGTGQGLGVGFVMSSIVMMQIGASFAKRLTETMATPLGAVWMRLAISGVVFLIALGLRWIFLWLVARMKTGLDLESAAEQSTSESVQQPKAIDQVGRAPAIASALTNKVVKRPRQAWLAATAFGISMVCMNSLFYEALARIPVGIVITLEYLGPLAVAIIASRHITDFIWIALAGAGVAILGLTPTALTMAGVLFALGAAVCWALYIVLGAEVAKHFQGVGVLTVTTVSGALVLLPAFVLGGNVERLSGLTLGLGLLVALACTVLPYTLELLALGRLPKGLFAILLSISPALAALAAWVILGEELHFGDWLAIACVVAASIGSSLMAARLANRQASS